MISLLFERVLKEKFGVMLGRNLRAINGGINDVTDTAVYVDPQQIQVIDNRYNDGYGENFSLKRRDLYGTGKVEYFAHFEKDPDEIQYLIVRCNDKYQSTVERIIFNKFGKKVDVSHERNYTDRLLEEATVIEPSASYFENFDDDDDNEFDDVLDLNYYRGDPQAIIVPFSYSQETGASSSSQFRVFGRHFDHIEHFYNMLRTGEADRRTRAIAITDSNEKELKDVYTLNDDGEYHNVDGKLLNLIVVKEIGPTEFCTAVIDDWNVDTAPEYFA